MSDESLDNQVLQRTGTGDSDVVTVADIRALLEQGLNTKAIKRFNPDIKSQTVALARAFWMASDPEGYDRAVNRNPVNDYKILIDENLPPKLVSSLQNHYKHVTHTKSEDLNGKPDQEVWRWAVNNNVDAIVTRDRRATNPEKDLTSIAFTEFRNVLKKARDENASIDVDELPLIIHVYGNAHPFRTCTELFAKHTNAVRDEIETRSCAKIRLAMDGVHKGRNYVDLSPQEEKSQVQYETIDRRDRWAAQWMKTILNGQGENQKNVDNIRRLVVAGATICAMETLPESRFLGRNKLGVRPVGSVLP